MSMVIFMFVVMFMVVVMLMLVVAFHRTSIMFILIRYTAHSSKDHYSYKAVTNQYYQILSGKYSLDIKKKGRFMS